MNIFTEGKIGKLILKNRIIRSAANDHLGDPSGTISSEQISLYENLAKNHIGMIITGHFGVSAEYRAAFNQPLISDDSFISSAVLLAESVHRHDGLICGQISHAGAKSTGRPFDINSASAKDLAAVIPQFSRAAKRLQRAGYDGVQIHLAHGYLLSDVLDNTVNRRTDQYGSSPENRFRLVRDVLTAVRETCGDDYCVIVKLNSNNRTLSDYDDTLKFYASELEKCRVDAIELSGWNFYDFPSEAESYFLREALMLGKTVRIPLIPVGGFSSKAAIENALDAGADFVSCCRAFLCDPDFVTKLMSGEVRGRCTSCGQCRTLYKTKYRNCIYHPESAALRKLFMAS